MTEKQANILAIAMQLFAEQGYEATPTSQIAKRAGVSEGLIFRHFENKEGLLKAILDEGEKRLAKYVLQIVQEPDFKRRIALVIDLAPTLVKEERAFWALQFTLKFKTALYAKLKSEQAGFKQLFQAGIDSFAGLGYANPIQETQLLMILLEGLTGQMLAQTEAIDFSQTIQFVKEKYQII
jgi:AcrR family transcriptional regulator